MAWNCRHALYLNISMADIRFAMYFLSIRFLRKLLLLMSGFFSSHLSKPVAWQPSYRCLSCHWRRGRDSNPRCLLDTVVFKTTALDHYATSPLFGRGSSANGGLPTPRSRQQSCRSLPKEYRINTIIWRTNTILV